jgi:hypothetical protein
MILPATSSMTKVQKLAMKTTMLALMTSFCMDKPLFETAMKTKALRDRDNLC